MSGKQHWNEQPGWKVQLTTEFRSKALAPHMKISRLLGFERNKEHRRFYLLPGMGGRALRRKHRRFLGWSIAIGLVVSGVLAWILFVLSCQR